MKHLIHHVKKHSKRIVRHLSTHKHKYLFGTFGTFAIVKTFGLMIGFFGLSFFGNTFAAGDELNATNITQAPYNCAIDATECNLGSTDIGSIASETFVNHTNLTSLYLSNNQISSIEKGDFDGLSNLTQLRLDNNQITSIESGDFDGLSNLTELDLYNNQITSIESGDFDGLSSLTTLGLGNNQISSIEKGDFDGLSNLTQLRLDNNQITSIESGDFDGLSNLTELHLSFNQISSIGDLDFSKLSNLTFLGLAANQITSLEPGVFSGLINLKHLLLNINQISSIESGDFAGLDNLLRLDLGTDMGGYGNQISSLEEGDFYGLDTLEQLSLAGNKIISIDSKTFDNLTHLTYINLDSNCINTEEITITNYLDTLSGVQYNNQYACTTITYTPSIPTSGSVLGSLTFFGPTTYTKELVADNNLLFYDYLYTSNSSYSHNYSSIIDTTGYLWNRTMGYPDIITGEVSWIDTTPPIATIIYSPTENTTGNVLASISLNETGTITNNNGETGYLFNDNGIFVFEFMDLLGNTGTITATVSWIYKITSSSSNGGGGVLLQKDTCPAQRDCSNSYYDNLCGPCVSPNSTTHGSASCEVKDSPYSSEITSAFSFAYDLGITTQCPITKANLNDFIIRSHFAKMVTEFAIKVLKKMPNTKLDCTFGDINTQPSELKFYIKTACQLGLMGRESDGKTTQKKFNPKDTITRSQLGTVLSRLLYGGVNNSTDSEYWYTNHLQALKKNRIMNDISKPDMKEIRGYILLMMQRIADKQ